MHNSTALICIDFINHDHQSALRNMGKIAKIVTI